MMTMRALTHDDRPHWVTLDRDARALADALTQACEPPHRGSRRWRQLAAYRTLIRNFRFNRELQRQGRHDLRPLYFIWTLLRTCNFRCTYCDDHRGRKYPELSNEGVLDTAQAMRLLEIMRTRAPSVYFAGGEPMARKDLPELTRHAARLSYYPIIINTNGSLVDRVMKRKGAEDWLANTDIVVVSLDALRPGALRELWRFKRPEVVVRNLLVLRELAASFEIKLMVNCVIRPGHLRDAYDVLDFANEHGIWFCPVPVNVGPAVHPDLRDNPEYERLVETILERKRAGQRITGSVRLNERLLRFEPLDCRNTLKPHIDYDGALYWPCKATVNVPPERINVLEFDHVDDLYDYACTKVDPTRFHGPAANQCGATCNWAQNYTTDAYAHGLAHPLGLLREIAGFVMGA